MHTVVMGCFLLLLVNEIYLNEPWKTYQFPLVGNTKPDARSTQVKEKMTIAPRNPSGSLASTVKSFRMVNAAANAVSA
jgi:hypothetical protein